MKKHLIAAAVVSAFAAPAMAQNVSVYGVLDVGYNYTDTDVTGGNSALNENSLVTSRLGFRGSEDLGGGLKAEFQLEGKLQPTNGELGKTSGETSGSNLFDRESWVGLAGNFGAVRVGRSDVTDVHNIDSKVSQLGNLGLISTNSGDLAKTIRYSTPSFKGFSAQIGYASPDSRTTSGTAENTINSVSSVYLAYEAGPLGLYIGQDEKKISATLDQKQTTIGAKYDFGMASVGLVYGSRDNAAASSSTAYTTSATGKDLDMTVLSVAVPLSNGYKLHAAYESQDLDGSDAAADFSSVTLAVTKSLSKRTSLYAAFISTDKDLNTENDSKSYTVGVVHSF